MTVADGLLTVAGEVSMTTLDIGGTNVTSTAAELNVLDGITAVVGELNALDIGSTAVGTAVASKAVILDSNKDYTGVRNFTLSGELDAGSLDISGNADIDGTLEADAITVNGTALAEVISDTVGAMVSSNTESGITVTYQDADNTLDFTVGTLNQNTTGSAATLTTARTIGGVSFNGSANINLPGVNSAGNQNTTGSAATLTTARAIAVDGDVTGTANFNGSAGISITTTLATNAIVTANITDGNVTVAKMAANSIDSAQYVDGSIDREHLAADIIDGTKIANDAINSEHYAAGSIDNEHIADNAINSEHYADGSIDRAHLAADIIDGTKIANDAINSEHYAAGSIDAEHLASDSVTEAKMAANSVDSQAYVDGSIDQVHLANAIVNEAKMQISNSPTNGYFLSAQSGNTGGLTWAEVGGGVTTGSQTYSNTSAVTITGKSSLGQNNNYAVPVSKTNSNWPGNSYTVLAIDDNLPTFSKSGMLSFTVTNAISNMVGGTSNVLSAEWMLWIELNGNVIYPIGWGGSTTAGHSQVQTNFQGPRYIDIMVNPNATASGLSQYMSGSVSPAYIQYVLPVKSGGRIILETTNGRTNSGWALAGGSYRRDSSTVVVNSKMGVDNDMFDVFTQNRSTFIR